MTFDGRYDGQVRQEEPCDFSTHNLYYRLYVKRGNGCLQVTRLQRLDIRTLDQCCLYSDWAWRPVANRCCLGLPTRLIHLFAIRTKPRNSTGASTYPDTARFSTFPKLLHPPIYRQDGELAGRPCRPRRLVRIPPPNQGRPSWRFRWQGALCHPWRRADAALYS